MVISISLRWRKKICGLEIHYHHTITIFIIIIICCIAVFVCLFTYLFVHSFILISASNQFPFWPRGVEKLCQHLICFRCKNRPVKTTTTFSLWWLIHVALKSQCQCSSCAPYVFCTFIEWFLFIHFERFFLPHAGHSALPRVYALRGSDSRDRALDSMIWLRNLSRQTREAI